MRLAAISNLSIASASLLATLASVTEAQRARPVSDRELAARDSAVRSVLAATPMLVRELRELTDRQRAAVVSLVVLANAATGYERTAVRADRRLSRPVLEQIGLLAPRPVSGSGPVALPLDACLTASIAYVSALASCRKEGKSEDQCPGAWEAGALEIACMMKSIGGMKDFIGGLFGPLPGPKPFPPIDARR